ncbi:MAG: hypothetical protein J5779_00040 [Clostridia bacterium]|nr:hypothetical protein [Clostridia bacterium]
MYRNPTFKDLKPFNKEMMGKKMCNWVKDALCGFETKSIACEPNSSIIPLIKPMIEGYKTAVVLYSDTPLLTKNTVEEILDYFSSRNLNVLKLPRGYVLDCEYIKNVDSVSDINLNEFNKEEFEVVCDAASFAKTNSILKQRILDFHTGNGVMFEDINSCFVDADVIIEPSVKICSNNVLKGETYIGNNVVLEPNNTIINSIISQNCIVKSSYIKNSKITENMVVGPFELIEEKES